MNLKNPNKIILTHISSIHCNYDKYVSYLHNQIIDNDNLEKYAIEFLMFIKKEKQGLIHNNYMFSIENNFPSGINSTSIFINIEKIKEYIENKNWTDYKNKEYYIDDKINMFYSLPQNYYNSIANENKKNFTILINKDFLPYSDKKYCHNSEFFSSNPYIKGLIKKASNIYYNIENYFSIHKILNYLNDNISSNYNYTKIIDNLSELKKINILSRYYNIITRSQGDKIGDNIIEYLNSKIINLEQIFKENIENEYKINIGQICYLNYIVNNTKCLTEFILLNESEKIFNISFYNPNLEGNFIVSIELNYTKYRYSLSGKISDFFCLDGINNINFQKKCFLTFLLDFQKDIDLVHLTIVNIGENNNPLKSLDQIIKEHKIREQNKKKLIKQC